jgi:hypothetical protein
MGHQRAKLRGLDRLVHELTSRRQDIAAHRRTAIGRKDHRWNGRTSDPAYFLKGCKPCLAIIEMIVGEHDVRRAFQLRQEGRDVV